MTSPDSQAALMQRVATVLLFACALAWAVLFWPAFPEIAVVGSVGLLLAHAWILALEFLLLAAVRKADPVDPAPPARLLGAWVREVVQSARVFAWRQPWRWRCDPDRLEREDKINRHGVVLVHGFLCNRGFWAPWMRRLRAQGRPFVAVNLEPVFGLIDGHAPTIDAAVRALHRSTGLPPVIVGHSMGGLAIRAWLRTRADVHGAAAHIVTIGTPHGGTWLARFSHLPNGRQMRQDSPWLRQLQADWVDEVGARTTCWHSDCDNVVMPPSTATLAGAANRLVAGAAHVDLAFRREVMDDTFALMERLDASLTPPRSPPRRAAGHRSA